MLSPSFTMSNHIKGSVPHDPPELAYSGDAPEPVQAGLEVASHNAPEKYHDVAYHVQEEETPLYQASARSLPQEDVERRKTRSAVRPLTVWLVISLVLAILLAAALGAVFGVKSNQNRRLLAACRQDLTMQPSPSTTNASTSTTSGIGAASSNLISTCIDDQVWISNLTRISYVQKCNTALTTDVPRSNVATAVVESFEACMTMCDVFNYNSNGNMSFASWTNNGSSTNQAVTDPVGQCYCVSPAAGYTVGTLAGKFSLLKLDMFKGS